MKHVKVLDRSGLRESQKNITLSLFKTFMLTFMLRFIQNCKIRIEQFSKFVYLDDCTKNAARGFYL